MLELISFDLCPFVQRSAITLLHKGVDFETTYIDLQDKPQWFLEISPTGKVPVLRMGEHVLFESAVINEYLDETQGAALMPADPLVRAKHRGWIEFGSGLLGAQYGLMVATSQEQIQVKHAQVRAGLERIEPHITGPLFGGSELSLVDTAYAPLFMRLMLILKLQDLQTFAGLPKVTLWAQTLLALPEVQGSVRADFEQRAMDMMANSALRPVN